MLFAMSQMTIMMDDGESKADRQRRGLVLDEEEGFEDDKENDDSSSVDTDKSCSVGNVSALTDETANGEDEEVDDTDDSDTESIDSLRSRCRNVPPSLYQLYKW